jgi:peptidoglycan/LPS O-acetylase OafA/YrhL
MFHWLGTSGHYYDIFSLLGFYGVEIFFVLSGFLIGNILVKSYLREPSFKFKTVLNFWMRRWMRTLPLYYFILIAEIISFNLRGLEVPNLWKYFFFLQNFFFYDTTKHDFYGVSWSLSIEEWFYISFPLILIFTDLVLNKLLTKTKILILVIVIFIIGSLLIRTGFTMNHMADWKNVFRKGVICREDSIAFGVVAALLYNLNFNFFEKRRRNLMLAGLILLFAGAVIFYLDVAHNYSVVNGDVSFFSKTLLFTIVSLGVLLTIPYFYFININSKPIVSVTTFISTISYSLYLVHPFLLEPIASLFKEKNNVLIVFIHLILFLGITTIISFVTYTLIEKTFLNVRNRFFSEKHKPV